MIISVCTNPSRDCTVELDSLNVGKLNRIRNKIETYSGKALNVAIGVARLGAKSLATGFMFEDGGKQFEDRLSKEGVLSRFVYNPGSVRVNYKIIDNKSMLTEINDKGEFVSREKQKELCSLLGALSANGADMVVVSGSLPQGVDAEYYYELVSTIPAGVKVVADSGKENLSAALRRGVYLVKPNLYELEEIFGEELRSLRDVSAAAKRLLWQGAENVLVSMGADGAVFTDGNKTLYCKSASVAVNSTVGAGDSMVASACVATLEGAPPEELLMRAVAAGTASIITPGTNLFYRDKYEEILKRLSVETL